MAQEALSSAILIIAAIIATAALISAIYPSLFTATGSVSSAAGTASDRVKTDVRISAASSPNASALDLWAKNVGSTSIPAARIQYTDVYFGDRGSLAKASISPQQPLSWSYALDDVDGDGSWGPGETLEITIYDHNGTRFAAGDHQVKLVLYNAAVFEDTITI